MVTLPLLIVFYIIFNLCYILQIKPKSYTLDLEEPRLLNLLFFFFFHFISVMSSSQDVDMKLPTNHRLTTQKPVSQHTGDRQYICRLFCLMNHNKPFVFC